MAAEIQMDGKGLLADFVYNQLSENYSIKRQSILEEVSDEIELVLVLHDSWHPSVYQKAEERFRMQVSHGLEVSFRLGKESLVRSYALIHKDVLTVQISGV